MSDIKIYQNQGGDIRWDGRQSARYDKGEPGGCVKGSEFLREDDPRYPHVAKHLSVKQVDTLPAGDDIEELQAFIDRGNFKPEWIAGRMERLLAEAARVEAELRKREEAEAEQRKHDELLAELQRIGTASPSQKEAGLDVKGIQKLLDPNVVAILNNLQMTTKEKLIELRATDKRFFGWSNADMGKLLGVSGQRITQLLAEMEKEAKKAKKEAENRIDEKFVDDRRRPQ